MRDIKPRKHGINNRLHKRVIKPPIPNLFRQQSALCGVQNVRDNNSSQSACHQDTAHQRPSEPLSGPLGPVPEQKPH